MAALTLEQDGRLARRVHELDAVNLHLAVDLDSDGVDRGPLDVHQVLLVDVELARFTAAEGRRVQVCSQVERDAP